MEQLKRHLYEQGVKEWWDEPSLPYILKSETNLERFEIGFTIRDLCYQYEHPNMFLKPDEYFYGPIGMTSDGEVYESLEEVKKVIGNDKHLRIYGVLLRKHYSDKLETVTYKLMYEEPYEESLIHIARKNKQLQFNRKRIKSELELKGMIPTLVG